MATAAAAGGPVGVTRAVSTVRRRLSPLADVTDSEHAGGAAALTAGRTGNSAARAARPAGGLGLSASESPKTVKTHCQSERHGPAALSRHFH